MTIKEVTRYQLPNGEEFATHSEAQEAWALKELEHGLEALSKKLVCSDPVDFVIEGRREVLALLKGYFDVADN